MLVIYKDCTEMHGQQNIKLVYKVLLDSYTIFLTARTFITNRQIPTGYLIKMHQLSVTKFSLNCQSLVKIQTRELNVVAFHVNNEYF
jgi:hypothetical protein